MASAEGGVSAPGSPVPSTTWAHASEAAAVGTMSTFADCAVPEKQRAFQNDLKIAMKNIVDTGALAVTSTESLTTMRPR